MWPCSKVYDLQCAFHVVRNLSKAHIAEACQGVLSQEAHLFADEEKDYLTRTLALPCKFVRSETHLPPWSSFIGLKFPHENQKN